MDNSPLLERVPGSMGWFGTCGMTLQAGYIQFVVLQVSRTGVAATMNSWSTWDNPSYCWIVICKNQRFHRRENTMFGHRVPVGETDAFSPPLRLTALFTCGVMSAARNTNTGRRRSCESNRVSPSPSRHTLCFGIRDWHGPKV